MESLFVPIELAGIRFDRVLARLFPQHSRSRLQAWLNEGRITLNDHVVGVKHKPWGGERIVIDAIPLPEDTAQQAENISFPIVYEDSSILVINKPSGLVVHPGSGNWAGTLLNGLLHYLPDLQPIPRAGIVHRLDKDTSGLMVISKTLTAQTNLVRQLQAHTVKRHYLALVHGILKQNGTVDAPIGRHPVHRTRMAVVGGGRQARTHYQIRECFSMSTLAECALETGRTHQIRVHMAKLGHPLVGDPVYGKRSQHTLLEAFPRQALHAWRLTLVHPETDEDMSWEAEPPADFLTLLENLRRTL